MKKALFVMISIVWPYLSFSQDMIIQDDFEGNGTINNWFSWDINSDMEFTNPHPESINTSSGVLYYHDTGGQYAHVGFDVPVNFDLSENQSFTLKIYMESSSLTGNQPNQISLKLQNNNLNEPWSTQSEIIKEVITDQWIEVSFDFLNDPFINLDPGSPDPTERNDFNRIILQVNGENNNDNVTAYIDDFSYDGILGSGSGSSDYDVLVWSDEFDIDGPPNPSKWHHQTELPTANGWFNNELQHYTDRAENSYVEDGYLHIVAREETYSDQGVTLNYTSARLNSKFAFTYGRVDVRAKLPFGVGTWPAIWTLGKNIIETGGYWTDEYGEVYWPACGEIDIMEHWGTNQNYVSSAIHTPSSFGGTINVGGTVLDDVSSTFHTYSMEWTPDEIRFYFDGYNHYTYEPGIQNADTWPFDQDQYLLINVAMINPVAPNFTESDMVIDYVRVYQETPLSASEKYPEATVHLFPNPSNGLVYLRVEEDLIGAQVSLYSARGELVKERFIQNSTQLLDMSEYSAGIYMVLIRKGEKLISKKIVLE